MHSLWSTGWNDVSVLPSKPVPNSICGTEQDPKFPIELAAAVDDAAAVAAATVTVTSD